ncbi:MAG: glycosyl hydrolase family 32 [Kiritimatiellae bacterium]|jgi:hypothetical protein|nr:glycosyl hydrolase family 32 [Kiritimatiellia bacterium]
MIFRRKDFYGTSGVLSSVLFFILVLAVHAGFERPLEGKPAGVHFRRQGETGIFSPEVKLFTDRTYALKTSPEWLVGKPFRCTSIMQSELLVAREGIVTVLTPVPEAEGAASQVAALEKAGFVWIDGQNPFQLFGGNPRDCVRVYQKNIQAGTRLQFGKWIVLVAFEEVPDATGLFEIPKETLYNGIVLEKDPRDRTDMASHGERPLPVPYLDHPPEIIPIDIGRQLLVDDFLVESTTLERRWHKAVKRGDNPVMKPVTDLELGVKSGHPPMAAPFSGGVWYDGTEKLFKVWYCAGWFDGTAYAYSQDGVKWVRPELKVDPGTNRIIPRKGTRDSSAVIMDPDAGPDRPKYKMLVWSRPQGGELFESQDGLSWSEPVAWAPTGDRSTIFYNPFRKVWVYSIRSGWHARSREYSESPDFLGGAGLENRVNWLRADELDLPGKHWFYAFPDREPGRKSKKPSLYNFDAVAYESLMLGAFTIMQGPENNFCAAEGVPKMTEIHLGFSRDGFYWSRPDDRTAFIPGGRKEGTWDRAYLHSNAALCLVNGDELWFYYTGFAGGPWPGHKAADMYANASMGIATLRRDGFASMDAGVEAGVLTTRPVSFTQGRNLFVNVDTPKGELRVEVLGPEGQALAGYTADACLPLSVDKTCVQVRWRDGCDLRELQRQPVRLRFHLKNGSLYSFWVSDDTGKSGGYLAGGGPGYRTLRDE